MLREVTVALPPKIAALRPHLDPELVAELEPAIREITALDSADGHELRSLSLLLVRTESVASSKIEDIEAGVDDYARALHGVRSNSSAVSMVAATVALDALIDAVTRNRRIELAPVLAAHRALMERDPYEARYAGRVRTVQNWIGGSDHSPRGALYVPPPPETVDDYLDDLMAFVARDDLPALVQAALAHAQFESIHPFTDGNGRIGRALINAVLRRRGVTTRVVVPLASALVARRGAYFDLLTRYRAGDTRSLLVSFARASRLAAAESRVTALRLRELPSQWRQEAGPMRAGSAATELLEKMMIWPVFSADEAAERLDAPRSSVFAAIARLREAGIIRPLTDRKRDQIWGAAAVLDELDELNRRIGAAARAEDRE
jgi:Fic family protein